MRGELIRVWSETWSEIWAELAKHEDSPPDLFCELYRELSTALVDPPSSQDLADIVDSQEQSETAFQSVSATDLQGEQKLVAFFEGAFEVLEDLGGDSLSNAYFILLSSFLDKYNLRYDLRRPCQLCPTLPGVFAGLFAALRMLTNSDPHLQVLMKDFESAIRDLRGDPSDFKVKTCISKQTNLLEGLGSRYAGVTSNTLGAICNQVDSWPHESVREAIKSIYKFACDYPGIRHGGTPGSDLRPIDLRDMVAISIVLMGFSPYVTDQLAHDAGYGVP
jgi:hypothetical protein